MDRSLFEDRKKPDEKAVANERAKLTATYMNGLAIALIAVGYIAPIFSGSEAIRRGETSNLALSIAGGFCVVISLALHLGARQLLGRLR